MRLEQLSDSEVIDIRNKVANALIADRWKLSGSHRQDLMNATSINSTEKIIRLYRTLGLNSYRKGAYDAEIPNFMRPFVDRDSCPQNGGEAGYHDFRMQYVKEMVKQVKKEPRLLRAMEEVPISILNRHLYGLPGTDAELTNAYLHFSQLESALCNIYALFCIEAFGPGVYITGIDDQGGVSTRRHENVMDTSRDIYREIHSHAVAFLNMDPSVTERLIGDDFRWSTSSDSLGGLSSQTGGFAGFELLSSGIENKEFHSSRPHEIILNRDNIRSVTVVDHPPNSIGFCAKYLDGTGSIGYMMTPNDEGLLIALNSDTISNITLNGDFNFNQSNILFDLAGAIARDMFVCVQRDRYYSRGDTGAKIRVPKNQDKVIWLPRFKVRLNRGEYDEDYGDVLEKIVTLSPCHVTGHKRKCENPNPRQLEIARALGIRLPEGYTYVQEHARGEAEQRRQYKSRSAMSVLFEAR